MFKLFRKTYLNTMTHGDSPLGVLSSLGMLFIWGMSTVILGNIQGNGYEVDYLDVLLIFSVPGLAFLYFFLATIDWLIELHVSFITNGKKHFTNVIGSRLFKPVEFDESNFFSYSDSTVDYHLREAQKQNAYHGFGCTLNFYQFIIPTFYVFLAIYIVLKLPILLWFVGFVVVWLGIVWLARKTFMISERLSNHVNDPNAHEKLKNQTKSE